MLPITLKTNVILNHITTESKLRRTLNQLVLEEVCFLGSLLHVTWIVSFLFPIKRGFQMHSEYLPQLNFLFQYEYSK